MFSFAESSQYTFNIQEEKITVNFQSNRKNEQPKAKR